MSKIESGKPLHCVELVTGKDLTGTVMVSSEELRAEIYSYTDHFDIKGEHPLFLQTETNEIVSLHSNITTIAGTQGDDFIRLRLQKERMLPLNIEMVCIAVN